MIVDVTDLNFKRIDFNKSYDNGRYSKARRIYSNEDVEIESVDKQIKDKDASYEIKAYVWGNYSDYKVTLNIHNSILKECSCTCPDYENGNFCKHIIATCMEVVDPHRPNTKKKQEELLEKQRKEAEERYRIFLKQKEEEKKKWEYQKKYNSALDILRKYKPQSENERINKSIDLDEIYSEIIKKKNDQLISENKLQKNIKLEPKLILYDHKILSVSFKIGEDSLYVLKNVFEFYDDFKSQKIVEYGKKLKFKACKESFAESDHKILESILDYAKMIEYQKNLETQNYNYRSYYNTYDYKCIQLLEEKIDDFFNVIKDKKVILESYKSKNLEYEFTDKKLSLELKVKNTRQGEYSIKLNIKDYDYIVSQDHVYVLHEGKIYTLEKKESNVFLLKMFDNKDEILVPSDKKEEFSKYVLPNLEEYLNDKDIKKEVNDNKSTVSKLSSKIYLDLDSNGNIKLKLIFCYNDNEFNILDDNYEKYIKENNVKRNINEERKVLERIFLDGFEILKSKVCFLLKNEDYIYEFFTEKIEGYMNDFEVLATEKFKKKNVKKVNLSNISVRLESSLLEMDISKIDIDLDEIKKILQNYNIKKKYYKLKNGDFLQLEQSKELDLLNDISNSLDVDFSKINNGVIKLPPSRSIYLEKMLDKNKEISVTKNDKYCNLINNISNKNFSDKITISKSFEKVLRPYQKVGYKWLKVLESYNFGGILADDMGLGKTLQIIALLESSLKSSTKKPSIVVCPSSLVLNWKAEVEKWCGKIKVLIVKGTASVRKELINKYNEYDLIVTSYDLLKRDVLEYEGKKFRYIIADEAQYIKNFSTQNATSLKSLEGDVRFALTGTPIENSISELWSIFDFIMPGYLYNYNKFKKKFEEPILKHEDKKALERLKLLIEPFILRRIKKDVLTDLPEKNITILKNEMEKEQERLYYSYMAQIKKEVSQEVNTNGFEKSKLKILMLLTRLRQICCHPGLFIDNYKGESGKLKQCIDIVKEAVSSGHKILLFSQYTSMFEIIEKEIDKLGIQYYKLIGSTPIDKRISMVESFNRNEDVKIFLISLKAGGTGLNLTGADVVIHYDPWWNLSSENQATDRAYRIGQKNSVQVYKLITTNSIEEKINKLQEKKAKLSEKLLSTEETFINKLSKEEILSLFD